MPTRVECTPATEADVPRLGEIFEDALGPTLPALFPNGCPSKEQLYAWRSSILQRHFVSMTDPEQKRLRGHWKSYLYKATLFRDDDGPGEIAGAISFSIVPSRADEEVKAQIKHADSLLPPSQSFPDGFNPGAWDDMLAACAEWKDQYVPTHSALSVSVFVVDPSTQGTGVGAKLFKVAKDLAVQTPSQLSDRAAGVIAPGHKGTPLVLCAVRTAVGFYKKQGLVDTGVIDLKRAEETFHGMVYQER